MLGGLRVAVIGITGKASQSAFAQRCLFSSAVTPPTIAALYKAAKETEVPPAENERVTVTVNGFVRSVRRQKKVAFAAISDGSTYDPLQVVLTPDEAKDLSTGVAVSITGEWKETPTARKQSHEVHAKSVQILGDHDAETFPIQKKYHSPEYLRTIPHLRARSSVNSVLLRLRSQIISACTGFFEEHDFVQTHPPLITSSDCEGAGEVFTITPASTEDPDDFFREEKYLTVSSQLHLEALAASVGRVWALSPVFRAEKSQTARHLSEFYMLEAEIAFTKSLDDVMTVVEQLIRSITKRIAGSRIGEELLAIADSDMHNANEDKVSKDELQHRWDGLLKPNWPRIRYVDAVTHLQEAVASGTVKFEHEPALMTGLQAEHERYLAKTIGQDGPVFVTDYPREIKAFYMSSSDVQTKNDVPTVACFDLLVPDVCEMVGGSLREASQDLLQKSMVDRGLIWGDADEGSRSEPRLGNNGVETSKWTVPRGLQWYVDLRRYGSVPHGGFGMGFDRLLCYVAGVQNVRDVVTFPRWHGRCDC